MEKSEQKVKPSRLTVEELRTNPYNTNLTDEELEQQADTLLELSIILYNLYSQSTSESSMQNITINA
jgi:hypothetical protein